MSAPCIAIVPAAGVGRRMGGRQPKQYLPIAGKSILEHSILALLNCKAIDKVVVAISEDDEIWQTLPLSQHPQVESCLGGEERQHSVLAAIQHLSLQADVDPEQIWVLVHDAVRPCLSPASVNTLIDTVMKDGVGGLLAVPARDTLKHAIAETMESGAAAAYRVGETIDRSTIWQAQTPQMFRLTELQQALEHAINNDIAVTDEASALEIQGCQPRLVMGRHDNIKITWPEDLAVAAALLTKRNEISHG